MKVLALLALLLVAVSLESVESHESSSSEENVLELAGPCDEELCKLPYCRCSSTNIPGGLAPRDTPQFFTLTFDDGVNILNIDTYKELLYGRRNTNGCPASATFYINHEYTNYQLVNELYNNGHEIALHSISHVTDQEYWRSATYEDMVKEFGEQRQQMSHFASIPYDEIRGLRIPFLQMTGNASFEVMRDYGLTYDSSWPTTAIINPGLWPYTLDYASTQDCIIPPCPTASIPGVWVSPMVSWVDLQGAFCSMVDSCYWTPDLQDEDAWFRFILTNFERHYMGNRAPFGFFIHEWYISTYPAVRGALTRFLNLINNLNDVFMVNANEVIDWVKDPVPVDEYREKACRNPPASPCQANTCAVQSEHNGMTYWMSVCSNVCPRVYPWLGNPLGV